MVIGQTPGWPAGQELEWPEGEPIPGWDELDKYVPPQNIYGLKITDPEADDENKLQVILVSGVHPVEFNGTWALHATVEFLVSDDPRAEILRERATFYVYPVVNPDGRYLEEKRLDHAPPDPPAPLPPVRGSPELYAGGRLISTASGRREASSRRWTC